MEYFYYRLYIKEGFLHVDHCECVIRVHGFIEDEISFIVKLKLWFRTHHLILKIYDYESISKKEYEEELLIEASNF